MKWNDSGRLGRAAILLAMLWAVAGPYMTNTVVPPAPAGSSATGSQQEEPDRSEEAGDVSAQTPEPTGAAQTDPPPVSPPEPVVYDFSQPAPESPKVELDYFEDAAFVGDSRTDGFLIYSGIGRGKNLTSNGLSIFKLEEKKALTIGGEKYTLLEALALEQYGKVYFSLGVNELGYYDDEGFYQGYLQAIDIIRRLQPNAVIYIQGLIPLNEAVIAQTSGRTYLTNDHLRTYNDIMRRVAREKQVVFLDLYSAFVDENGQLPAEASNDGVHLASPWCREWLTYLQTHTVDYETLYPDGPPEISAEPGTQPTEGSAQHENNVEDPAGSGSQPAAPDRLPGEPGSGPDL